MPQNQGTIKLDPFFLGHKKTYLPSQKNHSSESSTTKQSCEKSRWYLHGSKHLVKRLISPNIPRNISLDLRKFDAWKKTRTYSPKWWFTMVESVKKSPTKNKSKFWWSSNFFAKLHWLHLRLLGKAPHAALGHHPHASEHDPNKPHPWMPGTLATRHGGWAKICCVVRKCRNFGSLIRIWKKWSHNSDSSQKNCGGAFGGNYYVVYYGKKFQMNLGFSSIGLLVLIVATYSLNRNTHMDKPRRSLCSCKISRSVP